MSNETNVTNDETNDALANPQLTDELGELPTEVVELESTTLIQSEPVTPHLSMPETPAKTQVRTQP